MKKTFTHLKKHLFFIALFCLLGTLCSNAATVTVNGINYTTSGLKATVAKYPKGSPYTGEIIIPGEIESGGTTYTVVATAANTFQDCTEITKVVLPESCVTIGRGTFSGCSALANFPIPHTVISIGQNAFKGCSSITEAFIPAGVATDGKAGLNITEFGDCTGLKKLVIEDSEIALPIGPGVFGENKPPLEELYIGRDLELKYTTNAFAGIATLKTITIGEKVKALQNKEFLNCSGITTINFAANGQLATLGSQVFQGCTSLETVTIPATITVIPANGFYGCKALTSVTWHDGITSIGDQAFINDNKLVFTTLPAGLKTIGKSAFRSGGKCDKLIIPEGVTSIGEYAFSGFNTTGIELPASLTSVGTAAFNIAANAEIKVAEANTSFKSVNDILYSFDGKTIFAAAPKSAKAAAIENFSDEALETIKDYALYGIPFKSITAPALKNIGNYGLAKTANLESFTINSEMTIGSNALAESGIKSFIAAEGIREIPLAICQNCAELSSVTLPLTTTSIKRSAFENCAKLKSLTFDKNLNYIEDLSIPKTIEEIICKNPNVPTISGNVFTEDMANTTVKVSEKAVDKYKAANGWNFLNIVGDSSIPDEEVAIGCPSGLYFATKGGKLLYKDETGNIIDTGTPSGAHAFQLASAHNRVYVGYAGVRFTYSGTPDGEGDGEVFYLNKSGDSFYRVTLLSNIGYHAFQDPFSLTVDEKEHKALIADRNVGIHTMDTETAGLYGEQPFLLQNNWLAYYGKSISYGAIGSGLVRDSEGVYWMGKKFNGNGIFRFNESDIHSDGNIPSETPFKVLFEGTMITTFTLDEANGYLYAYLQKGTKGEKPGIYRIPLSAIKENDDNTSFANHGLLIDDAPVLKEGSDPSELTGVTQISSNGENVYWAYIAPTSAEDLFIGDVALDANNPLHKSGIKTISATAANPEVTYAVENVEAYGVVAAKYNDPGSVDGNISDKPAARYTLKGKTIEVQENAKVRITGINGATISEKFAPEFTTVSFDGLESGLYIIQIIYTDGTADVVKVIK